jgi:hypothetical protein
MDAGHRRCVSYKDIISLIQLKGSLLFKVCLSL